MRPINLTEPVADKVRFYQVSQWPLWMLAFRPYFLAAGLLDRKSTRLNSSHPSRSRMPSSA